LVVCTKGTRSPTRRYPGDAGDGVWSVEPKPEYDELLGGYQPRQQDSGGREETQIPTARGTGDMFGISITVLGELYYAVYASQRKKENLAHLKAFQSFLIGR